jgi:dihydrofolate reductase
MIWAEARDRVIGAGGGIPWQLPGEQAMFKERTMGATIVMGRATWESLPRRPLPGRANVVLTRDLGFVAPGAAVAHSVDEVPLSDDLEVAGDTRAPELDDSWEVTGSSGWLTASNGLRYVVEELTRP